VVSHDNKKVGTLAVRLPLLILLGLVAMLVIGLIIYKQA
jgi:hypothetical protein